MAERTKAAVLKTAVPLKEAPGVRIPLPPSFLSRSLLKGSSVFGMSVFVFKVIVDGPSRYS